MEYKSKQEVVSQLKEWIKRLELQELYIAEIAYDIVGLLAVSEYDHEPEFVEIFDLAADLELPKTALQNREEKLEKLRNLIENL